jgi:STE24 endopeptidase
LNFFINTSRILKTDGIKDFMMNFYLILILSLILGVFALETLADLFNIGRLQDGLPSEFQGVYDSQKYSESLKYQKDNVRFELVRRTFFTSITLAFLLAGGFNSVDQLARSFDLNPVATGLIFAGVLSFAKGLLQMPFSIYDTFYLEGKYGFNKTTPGVFISDLIKGTLLGAILGGLIFAGIVYFFESFGPHAWLYSWLGLTLIQTLLIYLAPVVIMPLFNKFSPLAEGELKQAIEAYAKTQNFRLSGIFTMDGSKRSTKANAFFTGFGKFRRLVLFDTLVSKHTQEELVAVLAHEIGHFERKHIIKSMILSTLSTGIVFYTFSVFMNNPELFGAFRMANTSVYASVVFVGFVYSPILRVASIFIQMLSRKHEFEADEFARATYGKPEALISALKKLSVDNLSHLTPHPLKVLLDYSHPPILERIKALRHS